MNRQLNLKTVVFNSLAVCADSGWDVLYVFDLPLCSESVLAEQANTFSWLRTKLLYLRLSREFMKIDGIVSAFIFFLRVLYNVNLSAQTCSVWSTCAKKGSGNTGGNTMICTPFISLCSFGEEKKKGLNEVRIRNAYMCGVGWRDWYCWVFQ